MSGKDDKSDPPQGAEDGAAPAKRGGKKKLLLIAIPAVLFLGGGAGLWFTGILPGLLGMKHDEKHAEEDMRPANPIFVDLPDMVANLASPSNRPSYVKLQARLEVHRPEDVERVKQAMPRLQDMFQTYLREMRPEELRSSLGTWRLREELLGRANVAAAPARVADVLFTQLLIQ